MIRKSLPFLVTGIFLFLRDEMHGEKVIIVSERYKDRFYSEMALNKLLVAHYIIH